MVNRMRQPYSAMSRAPTMPGSPPPNVTPENMMTKSVARTRRGAYSLTSATVIGSTPEMPIPAMNLSHASCVMSCASTVAQVKMPKKIDPAEIAARRP